MPLLCQSKGRLWLFEDRPPTCSRWQSVRVAVVRRGQSDFGACADSRECLLYLLALVGWYGIRDLVGSSRALFQRACGIHASSSSVSAETRAGLVLARLSHLNGRRREVLQYLMNYADARHDAPVLVLTTGPSAHRATVFGLGSWMLPVAGLLGSLGGLLTLRPRRAPRSVIRARIAAPQQRAARFVHVASRPGTVWASLSQGSTKPRPTGTPRTRRLRRLFPQCLPSERSPRRDSTLTVTTTAASFLGSRCGLR